MPFTNQTLVQFLILFLLFITCIRFIFMHREKEDSLAILPLAVLFISAVNVLAFGFNQQNIHIAFLALAVFFVNGRALLRLSSRLVIDRYGLPFIISSIICLCLIVLGFAETVQNMPLRVSPARYEVSLSYEKYTGSFKEGFRKQELPFERVTLKLYKAEPVKKKNGQNRAAFFVPPVTADFSVYEAFICMLAREGYTVYCGEFSGDENNFSGNFLGQSFIRKVYFRNLKLNSPEEYKKLLVPKKSVLVNNYKTLLDLAETEASTDVLAVIDVFDGEDDYSELLNGNPLIDRVFVMNSVAEYKTPGWGPVENTAPAFAKKLGVEKDTGFFISNFLAQKAAAVNLP